MSAPGTVIFNIGTGRSGSTLFHRLLAQHPRVAFLTPVVRVAPRQFALHRMAIRLCDLPLAGRWFMWCLRAQEAWPFWNEHAPGFTGPFRDIGADDVTVKTKRHLRQVFPELVTGKRSVLLIKLTGWPRIGLLKEVFPECKIVHLIRNPRAVASSWLHQPWYCGWQGPGRWRWGPLTEEEAQVWRRYDQSFGVLAVIAWKRITEAYHEALARLPEEMKKDVMEIRYDRLCAAPDTVMADVLRFCNLEDSPQWQRAMARHKFASADDSWRTDLSPFQQEQLQQAIEDLRLDRFGPWGD